MKTHQAELQLIIKLLLSLVLISNLGWLPETSASEASLKKSVDFMDIIAHNKDLMTYSTYDVNDDDKITLDEMFHALQDDSVNVLQLFKDADINGDGVLSCQEFLDAPFWPNRDEVNCRANRARRGGDSKAFLPGFDWTYEGDNGQDEWVDQYPDCGKDMQSPVDIVAMDAMYDSSLGNLWHSSEYDNLQGMMRMENNGRSVKLTIHANDTPTIGGSGLMGTYRLESIHWHWGSNDTMGSEHTLDQKAMPIEMHLVHYNTKYGDLENATDKSDGLAVLGAWYELGRWSDSLSCITDKLSNVMYMGQETMIAPFNISSLVPWGTGSPIPYYRYQGSLTTPPCHESVTWTIFHKYATLNSTQLEAFRSLFMYNDTSGMDDKIVNNFRDVQPLNNRKIKTSVDMSTTMTTTTPDMTTTMMSTTKKTTTTKTITKEPTTTVSHGHQMKWCLLLLLLGVIFPVDL